MKLLLTSIVQCLCLAAGQVLLKCALNAMGPMSWSWRFFHSQLTNWWWLGCGMCFMAATVLWMYIIKHFPLSQAYPLISLSYVFGMLAAMIFFHEHIQLSHWIGVGLIMGGCLLIAQ